MNHQQPLKPGLLLAAALWSLVPVAGAQQGVLSDAEGPITVTLAEAVQVALLHNYQLQNARLNVEDARQFTRESLSIIWPQIQARSSYTRNLKTANPFAGSSAGDLFSGLGAIGWLNYNEDARTDEDPTTIPITLDEFFDRQEDGLDRANIRLNTDSNPFAVANEFLGSISITQKLFDLPNMRRLFSSDRASAFVDQTEMEAERQQQVVIGEVRAAYYDALLAQENARVARLSVQRTRESRDEMAQRVVQGVSPKMQRLTLDIELANLKTDLVRANDQIDDAHDRLKLLLGLPMDRDLRLRGGLSVAEASPYLTLASSDALQRALVSRPDLEQMRILQRSALNEVRALSATRLPLVDLFVNMTFSGRVPDNRSFARQDEDDPFTYTQGHNSYFSDAYWQPSVNVGFQMSWTLFNGLARRARISRARIQADRMTVGIRQQEESVRQEVNSALRNLASAHEQILAQQANVSNAELNYEFSRSRHREGVTESRTLRTASRQLDNSQLNYVQAVHAFLIAQNAVEVALGVPLGQQSDMRLALDQ
ncbi:MAG: TolC family protein [Bacteroidota bacterium]|nr:TolC family protein [Bacteroidota bacterium]MDE2957927.1 TolC family protein [Bacteroidota bacterium]